MNLGEGHYLFSCRDFCLGSRKKLEAAQCFPEVRRLFCLMTHVQLEIPSSIDGLER